MKPIRLQSHSRSSLTSLAAPLSSILVSPVFSLSLLLSSVDRCILRLAAFNAGKELSENSRLQRAIFTQLGSSEVPPQISIFPLRALTAAICQCTLAAMTSIINAIFHSERRDREGEVLVGGGRK